MITTEADVRDAREAHAAAAGRTGKRAYVRRIFSEIAPRYDLLNRLLSLGIDRSWRRAAVARLGWERRADGVYLDLCAGTLDVAATLAGRPGFRGRVVGADFAEPMLRAGRGKAASGALVPVAPVAPVAPVVPVAPVAPVVPVVPVVSDALALPLADGSCAGAIVAFGIRNVEDLDAALAEVLRVLEPGARFVILEFSTPRLALVRALYLFYFHRVLPLIGRVVSGHPTAYRYLPESVRSFPEREELAARMRAAGYAKVGWEALTLGIAAIHVGERT